MPVSVSLPPPPTMTVTVTWTGPLACPSLTVMVRVAVPLRPSTVLTVIVRAAPPAPPAPKMTLPGGTSSELNDPTLSVSPVASLSTSATVRLIVPEWSSLPQVAPGATVPGATVTVGASLTAVTVIVTVARLGVAVPRWRGR